MKRIASMIVMAVFAVILFGWISPASAQAQEGVKLQAKISFPFTINNQHFSAGEYQFDFPSDPFLLTVHNLTTHRTYLLDVHPAGMPAQDREGLVFGNDGGHYALVALHFSTTGDYTVPMRTGVNNSKSLSVMLADSRHPAR